jgi:hypothetical protein
MDHEPTPQHLNSGFETSTGGSHSLTLSSKELAPMPFQPAVLKAGSLTVSLMDFSWKWYRHYASASKISYLVTQLMAGLPVPVGEDEVVVTQALRAADPRFDKLCRVVTEHTGVVLYVEPGSEGCIDDDSVGRGLDLLSPTASDEVLRDFLFSTNNCVQTGNDKNDTPFYVDTDRGTEYFYPDSVAQPLADGVSLKVIFFTNGLDSRFESVKGVRLDTSPNEALFEAIKAQGVVRSTRLCCTGPYNLFEHGGVLESSLARLVAHGFRVQKELVSAYSFEMTEKRTMANFMEIILVVPPALKAQVELRPRARKARKIAA